MVLSPKSSECVVRNRQENKLLVLLDTPKVVWNDIVETYKEKLEVLKGCLIRNYIKGKS